MSKEKALKLINEYLAKQEPKRVDLSSTNELERLRSEYLDIFSFLREIRKIGVNLKKKSKEAVDTSNKLESKIKKELNNFEQKVKELGLNPNDSKEYKELFDILKNELPKYQKTFNEGLKASNLVP